MESLPWECPPALPWRALAATLAALPEIVAVGKDVELATWPAPPAPMDSMSLHPIMIRSLNNGQLNSDPFNLRAEEMAMQDCCLGLEIRRTWSEQELVRSFGGQMPPGTPDGMFETWDGTLTCVQVVRVPLVRGVDDAALQHTLTQTILCKVVKSQTWLRYSSAAPSEFIIFCWLPFSVNEAVNRHVNMLMENVRVLDHRFSVRLRLPAEPGTIFPALFASNYDWSRSPSLSESDVSSFVDGECGGADDEDESCEWDITWDWDEVEEQTICQTDEATVSPENLEESLRSVCDMHCIDRSFSHELQLSWDDNG